MGFQIKDFTSIAASMVNYAKAVQKRLTDFSVGSVARTLLESVAVEIEELYQQMLRGLLDAIPTAIYYAFDFPLLDPVAASGYVRITFSDPIVDPFVIPAGTVFRSNYGLSYISSEDVSVLAGAGTASVLVSCTRPGTVGNVAANAITQSIDFDLPNTATVGNDEFVNGSDGESETERLGRFQAFIRSLARGTIPALLYGAKTAKIEDGNGVVIERVVYAYLDEPWKTNPALPVSWVRVYIHNGAGGTSQDLVDRTKQIIEGYYDEGGNPVHGWKAAGVKVDVLAASETAVDVTGTLTLAETYEAAEVEAAATSAVEAYLLNVPMGESAKLADIIALLMRDVAGIENAVITAPVADVSVAAGTKIMPGVITWN